jgi:hypothetical protein
LKRFDVPEVGEIKTLVLRGETVKCYLPVEEIYDVIEAAHLAVGRGCRDILKMETARKYANVTTEIINSGFCISSAEHLGYTVTDISNAII